MCQDMGNSLFGLVEVPGGDSVASKIDVVDTIFARAGSGGDVVAIEGDGDLKGMALEAYAAAAAHAQHTIVGAIFDRGQVLGKRLRAGLVTIGWHGHANAFVRALVVVDGAPAVEGSLRLL